MSRTSGLGEDIKYYFAGFVLGIWLVVLIYKASDSLIYETLKQKRSNQTISALKFIVLGQLYCVQHGLGMAWLRIEHEGFCQSAADLRNLLQSVRPRALPVRHLVVHQREQGQQVLGEVPPSQC